MLVETSKDYMACHKATPCAILMQARMRTARAHEARAHEANSVCEYTSNARIYIIFVLLKMYMGYKKNSRQHFSQNDRLRAH